MQCERVPNDHLPECGQQNLDSECVLLMEGKLVRRILDSVQQQLWNLGQTLLDDASSSFRPRTNRYSLPFTFTNVGRSNRKGCLARTDICEHSPPVTLIGSWSFGSSLMNSPLDIACMRDLLGHGQPHRPERAVLEMRAALDAAPNQPVPPHLARAFQMRGARVAATECTDRAPQALLVACIAEVVSTLRIRRDSGVILIER